MADALQKKKKKKKKLHWKKKKKKKSSVSWSKYKFLIQNRNSWLEDTIRLEVMCDSLFIYLWKYFQKVLVILPANKQLKPYDHSCKILCI